MEKFNIADGKLIKCRNSSDDNGHIVIPKGCEQKWCPVADKAVGYENLAYCYYYGKGTVRNLTHARSCYKNAAICGSVGALCTVGDAYYNGVLSFPTDHAEAKKYYQKAAEKGSEHAASMLKKL